LAESDVRTHYPSTKSDAIFAGVRDEPNVDAIRVRDEPNVDAIRVRLRVYV
jgi:hypothetical protein